jgi:hypothetical protein
VRVAVILVCLCVGAIPLCLLNGQTFTNALVALPFFLIPVILCAAFALDRRTPDDRRRAWRFATTLTTILSVSVLFTLPSAYRFQNGFNEVRRAMNQARAVPQAAIKPGRMDDGFFSINEDEFVRWVHDLDYHHKIISE